MSKYSIPYCICPCVLELWTVLVEDQMPVLANSCEWNIVCVELQSISSKHFVKDGQSLHFRYVRCIAVLHISAWYCIIDGPLYGLEYWSLICLVILRKSFFLVLNGVLWGVGVNDGSDDCGWVRSDADQYVMRGSSRTWIWLSCAFAASYTLAVQVFQYFTPCLAGSLA